MFAGAPTPFVPSTPTFAAIEDSTTEWVAGKKRKAPGDSMMELSDAAPSSPEDSSGYTSPTKGYFQIIFTPMNAAGTLYKEEHHYVAKAGRFDPDSSLAATEATSKLFADNFYPVPPSRPSSPVGLVERSLVLLRR